MALTKRLRTNDDMGDMGRKLGPKVPEPRVRPQITPPVRPTFTPGPKGDIQDSRGGTPGGPGGVYGRQGSVVNPSAVTGLKKGGCVKKMASGGSASKRADGCAQRGKTRGKII